MTPDFPPPSDADLLSAFSATRSAEVFRQLVDRHLPVIHTTATRVLRPMKLTPHADDVAQSVFVLLAQKAGDIPAGAPLVGWLYKVTHYACANVQRLERIRQKHEQEAAAMRPTTTAPPTVSDAEALLDPALLTLSFHDRNALFLRYTQDLSAAEIARQTNVPLVTAKKRLRRALQKLRHYFAARGMLSAAPLALHALTPPSVAYTAMASMITRTALAPATTAGAASVPIVRGVLFMMKVHNTAKVVVASIAILLLLFGGFEAVNFLKRSPAHSLAAPELTVDTAAKAAPGPAHPAASQRDGTFSASDFNALPDKDRVALAISMLVKRDDMLRNLNLSVHERAVHIATEDGKSHLLQSSDYEIRRLNEKLFSSAIVHPNGQDTEGVRFRTERAWGGQIFRSLGFPPYDGASYHVGRMDAKESWSDNQLKLLNIFGLRGLEPNYPSASLARWIEHERDSVKVEAEATNQDQPLVGIIVHRGPKVRTTFFIDPIRDFMITKTLTKLDANVLNDTDTLEVVKSQQVKGVWMPAQTEEKVTDPHGKFVEVTTFEVRSCSIGDVTDADVRLDFPSGSHVNDSIQRINYAINPDGTFLLNPVAVLSEGIVRIPVEQQVSQIDDASKLYREEAIVKP